MTEYEPESDMVTFSKREKKILLNEGVIIYSLTPTTLKDLLVDDSQRRIEWHVKSDSILGKPARLMQVAIYPDPQRLFVPGSFDKTNDEIEQLLIQDGERESKQLGIQIKEILPFVPEASQVIFRHFKATGLMLLGEQCDYKFMITADTGGQDKEPTSLIVGRSRISKSDGQEFYYLDIDEFESTSYGDPQVGAVRWIVPMGKTK